LTDTAANASSTFYRSVDHPLADDSENLEAIARDVQRRANRSRNVPVAVADEQLEHAETTPFQSVRNMLLTPSSIKRLEVSRTDRVQFRTGDRVKVVLGTFVGHVGRIALVNDDNTASVDFDVTNPNDQEIAKRVDTHTTEIRKLFLPGDFVVVLLGKHRGVRGFIVQMDDNRVSIFQRGPKSRSGIVLFEEVGSEV
jgi:transcription antitermination factor NusG